MGHWPIKSKKHGPGVWGPPRPPLGPGQRPGGGFRGAKPPEKLRVLVFSRRFFALFGYAVVLKFCNSWNRKMNKNVWKLIYRRLKIYFIQQNVVQFIQKRKTMIASEIKMSEWTENCVELCWHTSLGIQSSHLSNTLFFVNIFLFYFRVFFNAGLLWFPKLKLNNVAWPWPSVIFSL